MVHSLSINLTKQKGSFLITEKRKQTHPTVQQQISKAEVEQVNSFRFGIELA